MTRGPEDDPIDRLEHGVDKLAAEHRYVSAQAAWENTNRIGLLWVHAIVGVFVGVAILSQGTAASLETILGPWARPVTGWMPLLGGLLLADGLRSRPRDVRMEALGLLLLLLWDLIMTVGFFVAFATVLGLPTSRLYPVPVYAGYAALITVHLWTLRKVLRIRRQQGATHA